MEITDKTYCGKKTQSGYGKEKAWGNVVANDLQIGHHRPTLEQLNDKGWMVYADTVYDPATEKLALVWSDDGSIISKAKIDLTAQELQAKEEEAAAIIAFEAARQKLIALDSEYLDLIYWQKTDAQIDTAINTIFNSQDPAQIALACRVANKQLAKGVRDVVDVIAQLRIIGIIPK